MISTAMAQCKVIAINWVAVSLFAQLGAKIGPRTIFVAKSDAKIGQNRVKTIFIVF